MAQTSSIQPSVADASLRRRQLFPAADDESDDLGHISPLSSSTPPDSPAHSPFQAEYVATKHNSSSFSNSTIADYVILENINDINNKKDTEKPVESQTPLSNKRSYLNTEISMSPLHLSPIQIALQSPKKYRKTGNDTPSRKSIIETLKTPQESSSLNSNVPKLIRKLSIDSAVGLELGKRKMPFSESPPAGKHPKLDPGSKVRTVLFPKPELSLSTASFYSKPSNSNIERALKTSNMQSKKKKSKSSSLYLCGRKSNKRRFGEINAGVRHKIRKPRPKKIAQERLKAALNILENSPLNDYLNEIRDMYSASSSKDLKQITPLPLVPSSFVNKFVEEGSDEETPALEDKENIKRKHSPPPDLNRRFFRFKRSSATVTVDKHMKLTVNDGKLSLLDASNRQETEVKLDLNVADLIVPETDNLISSDKIDELLFTLDDEENEEALNCTEQLVLRAHNSVTMSENAIHLHVADNPNKQANQESILLSPTSQMCSMTSGLALNSPKRAKQNISNILNGDLDASGLTSAISSALDMDQQKLFPIFYGTQNTPPKNYKAPKSVLNSKKFKLLPKNQLLLDAGQKRFGVTQCCECKFVYHMGDPNEELMHLNYHNAGNVLRFNGWKDERVVAEFPNARIIRVLQSDPKAWVKKVKDLVEVINRALGYYEMPVCLDNTQIYLYIKNKTIAGCLIAEVKTTAYRLLSDDTGIDLCSEASYPIKCGVNRIWVSQSHRKEGIGTSLMNSLRGNFMFGSILNKDDIAFSSPTEAGKAFATKYFNTAHFLIYT